MGTIVKQSSIGLVANYIGVLLGFINVIIIMPTVLQAEQIGLVNLIFAVVMVVYPLLDFSATQIINRYFTAVKDKQEILNLSFIISCIGACIFFFIFYFGKPIFIKYYEENSSEIIPYYWWIYFISILMSWCTISESFGIINGKYHVTTFFKEVVFRLGISFILILLYFKLISFNGYVHLYFIMYGLAGLLIILYLNNKGIFRWKFTLPNLSSGKKKSMFKYGGFTLFTGLAAVVAIRIDMIMLGSMEGLKDVGIYTIAMFMATTIEIPKRSVIQSSAPIMRIALKENDLQKVGQLQQKIILNLIIIGGLVLTLLMINLHDLYRIIPNGSVYEKGFFVVLLLGLAKLADILAGSFDDIILSSRYYILNIIFIFLLTVLSISFNYYLIPKYGLYGAAIATLSSVGIVVLLKIFTFKLLFKQSIYKPSFAGVLLFYGILGYALYYLQIPTHPIISIAIKSSIVGILVFALLKWTKISPDLNYLINQILKGLKLHNWIKM